MLINYSVQMLEIARTYNKGSFHRNAGHVLQVTIAPLIQKIGCGVCVTV